MAYQGRCQCCLVNPPDYDLQQPYPGYPMTEVYADMLNECYGIQVLNKIRESYRGICTLCVVSLRNALEFKEQVLRCQNQLIERFNLRVETKVEAVVKPDVKEEFSDQYEQEDYDLHFFDEDIKPELPDLERLNEEMREMAKDLNRKPERKGNGKKSSVKVNDTSVSGSESRKSPQQNLINETSESEMSKTNIQNVLKYSNCTPFFNKTIAGIACAYCRELYKDIDSLRKHTRETHENDEIENKRADRDAVSIKLDITDLRCTICKDTVNVIADLKTHLTNQHDIKFYDIKDYFFEFRLTGEATLDCVLCHSKFETFKMLLQHMNRHYRNYICDVCDLGFINMHRLKIHKKTHDVGNFKCSFCVKVFSTRIRQKCHEKYSHNTRPRYRTNCSQCDRSFTSYYQRNRHMTTVHNVAAATYKCNICDTCFVLKSKLTSHIKKVHLMERNHMCAQCGLGFFTQHSLDDHMIKHNGERVFKCTVCHKAYARKKTLREHMRIHNNDRRFKCGVCSMAFVQKCSMKSHMLSNHGITLSEFENTAN